MAAIPALLAEDSAQENVAPEHRAKEKGRTSRPSISADAENADLRVFLRRQNLATAVHAGLQVDVVRTAQFARVLVFDVGRTLQSVCGTAHTALGRGRFSF